MKESVTKQLGPLARINLVLLTAKLAYQSLKLFFFLVCFLVGTLS